MHDYPAYTRLALAYSVAFGLIVWGVGVALFGPRGWAARAVTAGVGAAVAVAGVAVFEPALLPVAAALGVSATVLLTLAGSVTVQTGLASLIQPLLRRRVFGAVMAVAAGGGILYEGWRNDQELQAESDRTLAEGATVPPATMPAAVVAKTDRGTPVTLTMPADPLSPAEATAQENRSAATRERIGHWIRRSPASDVSNCHGWVFTGGRFNLNGRQVQTILTENGYTPVATPAVGDVCVYRDESDAVSHTAVVRAVLVDGTVLVESKWGRLGVYLHAVGDSCYGTKFAYHHSPRPGHLLANLDSQPDVDQKTSSDPTP